MRLPWLLGAISVDNLQGITLDPLRNLISLVLR